MDVSNAIKQATAELKEGNNLVVGENLLNPIKSACKADPEAVKSAFYYLSLDLAKRNGVVRYRSLLVLDCLLHRSKAFRQLAVADLRYVARCAGVLKGTNKLSSSTDSRKVSPPKDFSVELESKGKELFEIWDHMYGDRYPPLRAFCRYLRESLQLDMPNILVRLPR
jgi:hypothetical protein